MSASVQTVQSREAIKEKKNGHTGKTGKVMTIIESDILSLICFIVKKKVRSMLSVKYVGEFFFILTSSGLIPSQERGLASVPC